MDDSDDQILCCFGTPLEPLDKDEVPAKKPIAVEDQIVTDENGKRRFHGAFTGGFSAGFWNTVGSLEGWKPQSFKSSRNEKAQKRQNQMPTDFMDEEDLGEFGIAPQRIQAREDFAKDDSTSVRKRKWNAAESGPIPGVPILHQLLEPTREKVAIRLLRKMGWKPGQGIGARQTRREKSQSHKRNSKEIYLMKKYGCTIANDNLSKNNSGDEEDMSEEEIDETITFAPDDFEQFAFNIKDNTFGLGYSGLDRGLSSNTNAHINLFASFDAGKRDKKLTISGQAFGVGALEEEDEDIYAKDDMSKYDFSLNSRENNKVKQKPKIQDQTLLEGFSKATSATLKLQDASHRVDLKSNFSPRNWLSRKTRFEPLPKAPNTMKITSEDNRLKRLDPDKRRDVFEKGSALKQKTIEDNAKVNIEEDIIEKNKKILAVAKQMTQSMGADAEVFKPFVNNEEKQNRYDQFIKADLKNAEEIKTFLNNIQPIHLSEWEKEMELKEFVQARSIYKPLVGLMSDRFVSKSTFVQGSTISEDKESTKIEVKVKRTEIFWKPCSLICKRFNVPDPHGNIPDEPKIGKKKNTFSVFDYMESSVNSKKNFVTPTIIPKRIEKPMENLKVQTIVNNSLGEEVLPSKSVPANATTINSLINTAVEANVTKTTELSTKTKVNAPKTDLEKQIEESRHKHPSEKKDIFKRIFDFSSDEENDTIDQKQQQTEDALKNTVPSNVVNALLKPSVPNNILRNNSPPRGIFASMFSQSLLINAKEEKEPKLKNDEKITFRSKEERIKEVNNMYGPKLPENVDEPNKVKTNHELLFTKHFPTTITEDKWIEKGSKKSPKKKEHKKKKSKHKRKAKKHKEKK